MIREIEGICLLRVQALVWRANRMALALHARAVFSLSLQKDRDSCEAVLFCWQLLSTETFFEAIAAAVSDYLLLGVSIIKLIEDKKKITN